MLVCGGSWKICEGCHLVGRDSFPIGKGIEDTLIPPTHTHPHPHPHTHTHTPTPTHTHGQLQKRQIDLKAIIKMHLSEERVLKQ